MAKSTEDIRTLSDEDLKERIEEEYAMLRRRKFNNSISPIENPLILRTQRREIARMLTELRAREIAAENTTANA